MQNGSSNAKLLIKNAQLKHAGRYTCTAKTHVDNTSASAHLVVRGELWAIGRILLKALKTASSLTLLI